MTATVPDELRELLADVLFVEPSAIPDDASSDTVEAWDSLRHLDVVLALEQRYGLALTPDEIADSRSVRAILALLERHGRPAR